MSDRLNERLIEALRREPDKIHPDIPEVREKARRMAEDGSDKVRAAVIREQLKEERKRERYKAKHKNDIPEGINLTDGCKIGNKNARKLPTDFSFKDTRPFGRISKQNPAGKGEKAGFNPQNSDFWKAKIRNESKKGRNYKTVSIEKAELITKKRRETSNYKV